MANGDVTPEQRQAAIDTLVQAYTQLGMAEDVATELAEASVDEAIARSLYK